MRVILSSKMPFGVALFSPGPPWTEPRQKTRKFHNIGPDGVQLARMYYPLF